MKSIFCSLNIIMVILTASACANTEDNSHSNAATTSPQDPQSNIKFSYQGLNKNLTITGLICRYGRSSKSQLPSGALQEIHQYVQQQPVQFVKQIKDIKQGMLGHRLDIAKLSVFYLLKQKNINFDYYVEGNQICANYQTSLTLDFNQDFISFIELNAPSKYQFIADKSDSQTLNSKLKSIYPDLPNQLNLTSSSKYLVEEKSLNNQLSILTFHYLTFKNDQMQKQNRVYVSGDAILKKALTQYLQENGFTVATSKAQAFWIFDIEAQKHANDDNKFKEFKVQFQNTSEKSSGEFVNDSSVLPALPTTTEQQQLNLVKLYLEMIEVAQQLRER